MSSNCTPSSNLKFAPKERRWVLGFAVLVMLVTTVPYFLGFQSQNAEWAFTGFVFNVRDGNNYVAKMLRGETGDWLFRTPYSASPQRGAFAFSFHILLGKLTAPPGRHEQMVGLYHLMRFVAGILMILATYDFLSLFVSDIRLRRWGLVLASLGGGLGWLLVILGHRNWLGSLPLEFYSPESFGFLILYGLPHLAFARALLLWGFVLYLRPGGAGDRAWKPAPAKDAFFCRNLFVGLIWLLMGIFQPLMVVLAWALLGVFITVEVVRGGFSELRENVILLKKYVVTVLVSSPIVIYTAISFSSDPFLRVWTSQNDLPAPHILHYLVAYGSLLPLVVLGISVISKLASPTCRSGSRIVPARYGIQTASSRKLSETQLRLKSGWFLVSWFASFPILVYAPLSVQRRLAEGFWVCLVTLALIALEQSDRNLFERYRYVFGLIFPSTIFLLVGGIQAAQITSGPVFQPAAEIAAFEFLTEHTDGEAVVLASFETGNAIPAWSPVFVVIGHGPESVGIAEIYPRVTAFYTEATSDRERIRLLDEFAVDYVFWGQSERALGGWDPAAADYLTEVFRHADVRVFAVGE